MQQYRVAHWPESFENRALPWEASQALIEQLRHWGRIHQPTVHEATWFYRLTLAAPEAPIEVRAEFALWEELAPNDDRKAAFQDYLVHQRWRTCPKHLPYIHHLELFGSLSEEQEQWTQGTEAWDSYVKSAEAEALEHYKRHGPPPILNPADGTIWRPGIGWRLRAASDARLQYIREHPQTWREDFEREEEERQEKRIADRELQKRARAREELFVPDSPKIAKKERERRQRISTPNSRRRLFSDEQDTEEEQDDGE